MKRRPEFTLILPCFNEELVFNNSVDLIIRMLQTSRFSFEICFVDDGSHDRTREMIKSVCKRYPFCRFYFHKKNLGRGAAVTTGIRHAHGVIVGYMDIDCEVSPLYIPAFVEIIKQHHADIVIGKRIYRTTLSSIVREAVSVGYRMLAGYLLGTGGIDTESGYKFFEKKAFMPVLKDIRDHHWFWDTESIVLSKRAGLRIREMPVLFVRRTDKHSSVRLIPDSWEYMKNVWNFYWRIRKLPAGKA